MTEVHEGGSLTRWARVAGGAAPIRLRGASPGDNGAMALNRGLGIGVQKRRPSALSHLLLNRHLVDRPLLGREKVNHRGGPIGRWVQELEDELRQQGHERCDYIDGLSRGR